MDASVPATPAEESPIAVARRFVTAGIENCASLQRDDLVQRLNHTRARLDEPSTVLYVAGGFKQGKSRLVNALVGQAICPVDDDLSTSTVTWLHHADPAVARIRRHDNGTALVEEIPLQDVWRYASEEGNPANHLRVDIVHIGLPSKALATGLALVDSPGAGALRGGAADTTLSFLPYADALIFVTDASAELSGPEVDFLRQAREMCPNVLVALTKIDLHPEWRRIAELDREHLSSLGLTCTVFPLSSSLRERALRCANPSLNDESGFPGFLAGIRADVLENAQNGGAVRALEETSETLSLLLTSLRAEEQVFADPDAVDGFVDELNDSVRRLGVLRDSGSRWTTTLGDGITDLNQGIDRHMKGAMRDLLERFDERLENADPAAGWDTLTDDLRTSTATIAKDVFDQLHSGADELAERVTGELRSAGLQPPPIVTPEGVDLGELWSSSSRTLPSDKRSTVGAGLGAIRGTSSGIVLLGVMSNLAGIVIGTPIAIGVGIAFGAKHVIDERKRNVERRRQQARTLIREYANQVNTEVSLESRRTVQEIHRLLRDSFSSQVTELNASLTETVRRIEASRTRTAQERAKRHTLVSRQIEHLNRLIAQTDAQRDRIGGGPR